METNESAAPEESGLKHCLSMAGVGAFLGLALGCVLWLMVAAVAVLGRWKNRVRQCAVVLHLRQRNVDCPGIVGVFRAADGG